MDRIVVKELIQDQLNAHNLKQELNYILNNKVERERIFSDYKELRHLLGDHGASKNAAYLINEYLHKY
jgi:lipid A disaccharide synthetase